MSGPGGFVRRVWFVLTLRCDAADRIRCACESDLGWHERWAERLHALVCRPCRAARRQLRVLGRAVELNRDRLELGPEAPLDAAARERLSARLRAAEKNGDCV